MTFLKELCYFKMIVENDMNYINTIRKIDFRNQFIGL